MALKLNERYPQRWDSPSNDYPQGAFKNLTELGEQDGSYLEQDWLNDYSGFFGALLRNAEMTPDGTIDTAQRSQFYDALIKVAKKSVTDDLNKKWDIQATTGTGNVARMSEVEKKWNSSKFIDHGYIRSYRTGETYTAKEGLGVLGWGYGISISHNLVDDGTNIHIDARDVSNDIYIVRYKKTESGTDEKLHKLITDVNTSSDSSGFLRTSGSKETFTKDLITQSTGFSTTNVMSQKAVTDRLNAIENGHGIGYGQEWINVKSERVAQQIYTNTTSKTIVVAVDTMEGSGGLQVSKDGENWVVIAPSAHYGIQAPVPRGHKYQLTGGAIDTWAELR